jgi:hypothetical protein
MSEYHETGEIYGPENGNIVVAPYRRSPELNELFGALAKSQGEYGSLEKSQKADIKTKTGGSYSYTYATLADTIEATQALHPNGLSVLQFPTVDGAAVTVTTLLGHSSGQWIESTLSCAPTEWTVQAIGSVITYLRRYARQSITGIAPEDDDGAAGVSRPTNAAQGVTRMAAPRPTNAATRPAISAVASPGPSSTGKTNGTRPEWVSKFLTRGSYELDLKVAGGWSAWEKFYCDVADGADNLDQLLKLDDDNKAQIKAFAQAHQEGVYNNFCKRVAANAKRLAVADRAAPLVEQADAERVFES